MFENFDALEKAIDDMSIYIEQLTSENVKLKNDISVLKSTLDDRNTEIEQLQREMQTNAVKVSESIENATEVEKRVDGLLARVRAMQQKQQSQALQKSLLDD